MAAKLRVAIGAVQLDFETDAALSVAEVQTILDGVAAIAARFQGGASPVLATLAGIVTNVFGGGPIGGASISSIGLVPEFSTRSGSGGSFRVETPGLGSDYFVRCEGSPVLVASTCGPFTLAPRAAPLTVETTTAPDLARQYAAQGLAVQPRAATLVLELQHPDGRPLAGLPASDISLASSTGAAVGVGPFFIGTTGDALPQPQLPSSVAVDGRARAVFLDCTAGTATVTVATPQGRVSAAVRLVERELTVTTVRV